MFFIYFESNMEEKRNNEFDIDNVVRFYVFLDYNIFFIVCFEKKN